MLWSSFLQKQALTGFLEIRCSKQKFGKLAEVFVSVFEKRIHHGCFTRHLQMDEKETVEKCVVNSAAAWCTF